MRIVKTMLLAAMTMGAPIAMADVPPATAPAPSAAASVQSYPAAPTVLVLPFQQTGDTSSFGWVSPAIQENLLGQVAHGGVFQALSSNQPVAGADSASAVQIARTSNANVVVFGGYQVVSDQIRVDGMVLDVASGRVVGTLQATGQVQDLFKMEDSLAAQLSQILPAPPQSQMPEVTYGTPNEPMTASTQSPDTSNYSAAPYVYNPSPDYTPTYYYPAYGYGGYPYYYYPSYIIIGGGFHNRCFVPIGNHGGHFNNAPLGRGQGPGGFAPSRAAMPMGAGHGR
jgi:TolB-like protein